VAEIKLINVSKTYDGKEKAVDNINLEIKDKEFVVLVGPSGCGKTTTLRMIAGLEDISEGEIYIDNVLVNNLPPKERDIAMVFQNYALYPHMSVYDNIAFGLKLKHYSKEEINNRVNEAAKILGIEQLLNRKPKALSGGQRQRVAVGRAIVRKPKVFLFDEPLSNLDAKLRVQMRTEISKLHHKLDATMVYVTHDQTEAMTMGDRIVILNDGIVQQIDTPLGLYNNPLNKFVAGFIGSPAMNFLNGKIINNGNLFFVFQDVLKFKLPDSFSKYLDGLAIQNVTLGIRPENINIADDENNLYSTKIDVVEPMGSETFLYFTIGSAPFVARVSSSLRLNAGDKIGVKFNYDKIYFFDSLTGRNLLVKE